MLELLKVIVQPVILERDPSGKIVGEKVMEPMQVYSEDEYKEIYTKVEEGLEKANAESEVPETL
jgi:hypothetical protein